MSSVYEDRTGRVRGLVILLGDGLSRDEASIIEEFLDHGELGEALDLLASFIVERNKLVPRVVVVEIVKIACEIGIEADIPSTLADHADPGGH